MYFAQISGSNVCEYIRVIDWKVDSFKTTVSFLADTDLRVAVRNSCVPGATEEFYNILGEPVYWDTTLNDTNTIVFYPLGSYAGFRRTTTVYVSSYAETELTPTMFKITISGPSKEMRCSLAPSSTCAPQTNLAPCVGLI